MAITPFLAMTAGEIAANTHIPEKIAWMACHFSPYGPGLSNLPRTLPAGSLLMVDDVTPLRRHDHQVICRQLNACVHALRCSGVVLDFQRPGLEETAALVDILTEGLPCPVAVSHFYAAAGTSPVIAPPVPPSEAPQAYFRPWQGREIWLEISPQGEEITVTERGAVCRPLPWVPELESDFFDETLLCHYRQEVREDSVIFTMYRTEADLQQLLKECGIAHTLGLYQEFQNRSFI